MDDAVIDVERKLVRSMVGKGTKILNANGLLPEGQRLVVGENTAFNLLNLLLQAIPLNSPTLTGSLPCLKLRLWP